MKDATTKKELANYNSSLRLSTHERVKGKRNTGVCVVKQQTEIVPMENKKRNKQLIKSFWFLENKSTMYRFQL